MVAQASVESSPDESSSSNKDGDGADATRIGFIINNNGLWTRDHRTVTGLIFAGTLVACERVGGVGV